MSFGIRSANIAKMYYFSRDIYRGFKKNTVWPIEKADLLNFPKFTLGSDLGLFLERNNFEVEKKLENHDIFHILTEIDTTVSNEITLQYYLLGNGKLSFYLVMVIISGTIFYPEKWLHFAENFSKGQMAERFYDLNFWELLQTPTQKIKSDFGIS